jgi:putative DNA primase/helicase
LGADDSRVSTILPYRNQAVDRVRRRYLVAKLRALRPAPFAYFPQEIEAGADVGVTLEEHAALLAEFRRALGGDLPFPHARRRRGMTIQPDRGQAAAFLRFLDPGATKFTFQIFDDSPDKRPGLALVLHGSLDSLWDGLASRSQRGTGVFVCVNETNFRGRKAGDIVRVRALFADLDGAPLANVWNVPLAPGWITRTSEGRYHVFWRVAGIALAEFTPLQKEIIDRTGGDRAIHDLPRVMRLPGFPHQKGKPYFVEGQAIEGGAAVNGRGAVLTILPPPAAPAPVGRHTVHLGNGAGTERRYALAALQSEACYVEIARPGERNNALNRAAFCVGTLIPGGGISASEVEAVLTSAALKAGLHPSEIATTLGSGISAGMTQPRRIGGA